MFSLDDKLKILDILKRFIAFTEYKSCIKSTVVRLALYQREMEMSPSTPATVLTAPEPYFEAVNWKDPKQNLKQTKEKLNDYLHLSVPFEK